MSGRVWRIRDRSTFAALRSSGTRARRRSLTVTYLPPRPGDPATPRVAYAIGKRIGGAVERNRLRRRLRGVVAGLELPAGDYLLGAAPEAAELSHEELRELVSETLEAVARGR